MSDDTPGYVIVDRPHGLTVADKIPRNGNGENHPDVVALRHQLSSGSALPLAEAGSWTELAAYLASGGWPDWSPERLQAAYDYLVWHDHARA
jgi:hypothetical protein